MCAWQRLTDRTRLAPTRADLAGVGAAHAVHHRSPSCVAGLSLIGIPLTVGFVSKWYLHPRRPRGVAGGRSPPSSSASSLLALIGYIWRVVEAAYFQSPLEAATEGVREAPLSPCWCRCWLLVGGLSFISASTHRADTSASRERRRGAILARRRPVSAVDQPLSLALLAPLGGALAIWIALATARLAQPARDRRLWSPRSVMFALGCLALPRWWRRAARPEALLARGVPRTRTPPSRLNRSACCSR